MYNADTPLFYHCDGSLAIVIVMYVWFAVTGIPPMFCLKMDFEDLHKSRF